MTDNWNNRKSSGSPDDVPVYDQGDDPYENVQTIPQRAPATDEALEGSETADV